MFFLHIAHVLFLLGLNQVDFSHSCEYTITPVTDVFGAMVDGIDLNEIDQECANKLKQEAFMNRFLLFRNQDLGWQQQIKFTQLLGTPFVEKSCINRKFHEKIPDKHIGYFSNDPAEGVTSVGIEGWHVDGNVAEKPHMFTIIYCIRNNKNGPTLVVPLKEIVEMLSAEDRDYLENIMFVSGHNSSIIQPLLYKDQKRNDDTIMLALGKLSGQYLQKLEGGETRILSVEETQAIQDLLEVKILSSNKIYSHQYKSKDLLLLYNPSVAHIAGPGSQASREISGLRLMSRTTVVGEQMPTKTSNIQYECSKLHPYELGYCLFSLKGSVYYPKTGVFDTRENARKLCQRINQKADLAVLPTVEWNEFVKDIISCKGVPHWVNARNPEGQDVYWNGTKSDFELWDSESKQPNDCDGPEECVIIGPYGHWFDFSCGPKTKEGSDPGPVMTWENGERKMFNIYPLCGVEFKHLSDQDNVKFR